MLLIRFTVFLSILDFIQAKPVRTTEDIHAKEEHFEKIYKRQAPPDFFSTHPSSPNLVWYSCYTGLQCARLEVPLDYAHPVAGDVFKLAIVKLPAATAPVKGTWYIYNNLGGSPVDAVVSFGSIYQQNGGADFDIVAFDPRGQGHTTPQIQCFADAAAQLAYANVERLGLQLGDFNGTRLPTQANILSNIDFINNHQSTFAAGCKQYYGKYLPYIGTADAARDLDRIVNLIGTSKKIWMLFYSYYTVLGTTYASMHPNGFDRMINDGVVNTAKLYLTGDNGISSVSDAQKGIQMVFDSCAAAGPCTPSTYHSGTCCPFWASTAAGVSARYEALKGKYWKTPFKSSQSIQACGTCDTGYYRIATGLADTLGLGNLFIEQQMNTLREWEQGFAETGGSIEFFSQFTPDITFGPYTPALMSLDQGTSLFPGPLLQSGYLQSMNATSIQNGAIVANQELYAAGWPNSLLQPKLKNPYLGPIGGITSLARGKMMFLSNVASSQYPLINGKLMSALFVGSGLVTINALDNSFLNGASNCVQGYRVGFFNDGVIPPAGAFCNDISNGLFGKPLVKDYR